ncbi:hypothetical protein HRbin14_02125 [bacterium HR14]|nr:hypothetical protein HRbin14_02125 [bacterium HR14]
MMHHNHAVKRFHAIARFLQQLLGALRVAGRHQQAQAPALKPELGKVASCQVGDLFAIFQHNYTVCQRAHLRKLVRAKHKRLALCLEATQQLQPLGACRRVQMRRRLVQQQNRRVREQRQCQRQFLLETARKRVHRLLGVRLQLPLAQQGFHTLRRDAPQACVKMHGLQHRLIRVQVNQLRHIAHLLAHGKALPIRRIAQHARFALKP